LTLERKSCARWQRLIDNADTFFKIKGPERVGDG
jgi:hypothetical protein